MEEPEMGFYGGRTLFRDLTFIILSSSILKGRACCDNPSLFFRYSEIHFPSIVDGRESPAPIIGHVNGIKYTLPF